MKKRAAKIKRNFCRYGSCSYEESQNILMMVIQKFSKPFSICSHTTKNTLKKRIRKSKTWRERQRQINNSSYQKTYDLLWFGNKETFWYHGQNEGSYRDHKNGPMNEQLVLPSQMYLIPQSIQKWHKIYLAVTFEMPTKALIQFCEILLQNIDVRIIETLGYLAVGLFNNGYVFMLSPMNDLEVVVGPKTESYAAYFDEKSQDRWSFTSSKEARKSRRTLYA